MRKTGPFLRRLPVPLPQQSCSTQHPPHAGRTHRHDVCVQHHECQPSAALQRILQMERYNRLLFPIIQPKVSGNPAVVLIHLAVPLAPAVELAGRDVEPPDEVPGADLSLFRPAPDEIHDLVPRIMRNPDPGQSSPTLFLGQHVPPLVRPKPYPSSGSSFPDGRCVPVRPDGWSVLAAEKPRLRSRRTPSTSGRTRLAGAPAHHTDPRSVPHPPNASSEWPLSLSACSASVAFSCVRSVILGAATYAIPCGFWNPGIRRNHFPAWRSKASTEPFSRPETNRR